MTRLERRQSIENRHKVLASVPGSGWHKNDPQSLKQQAAGEMPICDRLIALQDDNRIYIVGPCVAKMRDGLAKFIDGHKPSSNFQPVDIHAYKCASNALEQSGDELWFHSQDWNGCIRALATVGITAVLADANQLSEGE